jgi:hypothetical protein
MAMGLIEHREIDWSSRPFRNVGYGKNYVEKQKKRDEIDERHKLLCLRRLRTRCPCSLCLTLPRPKHQGIPPLPSCNILISLSLISKSRRQTSGPDLGHSAQQFTTHFTTQHGSGSLCIFVDAGGPKPFSWESHFCTSRPPANSRHFLVYQMLAKLTITSAA